MGGFLYGGPFGAIAGFGNWVFNKIFDKTPTELALDATGISDIWKEEGEELEKIAKNNNGSNDVKKSFTFNILEFIKKGYSKACFFKCRY